MLRQLELEFGQCWDVLPRGAADAHVGWQYRGMCEQAPQAVAVLLPEAKPEPGADQFRVGREYQDVVGSKPSIRPAGCRDGVEVAQCLPVVGGVAG
jgi:hypothetical protein